MLTFSLCMIVKNEEAHLKNCLESATGIFDEIIIVDTGSTDSTKAIAAKYTDKIYDFQWNDDFSEARNAAFSHAKSDYMMWLDADDIIPEDTRTRLIELKSTLDPKVDVILMPYQTAFDADGKAVMTYFRERIVKNCLLSRWSGYIHETITPYGTILYLDIPIRHNKLKSGDPNRNILIYEAHIAKGEKLNPRDKFYYGRELSYHSRNQDAVNVLTEMLEENKGWLENNIEACRVLAQSYYTLNMPEKALDAYFHSFSYDTPRAEVCCDIGAHFVDREQYKSAIFWYHQALQVKPDSTSGAFILPDRYGYIPALQICLCYARLGDAEKSKRYNDLAASFKETDQTRHNQKIFDSLAQNGQLS
jgi:glycosyltransferase involved in cell wall biosynthesis